MTDFIDAPRNKRLRPEAIDDLSAYRLRLHGWVKMGIVSADTAMASYHEELARVVRDPAKLMDDFRDSSPVKCRRCGRPTSILKGVDLWACLCTPSVKRYAATDIVGPDGEYLSDPDAMPVSA